MADDGSDEIMLFGVRVKVDPMRKIVSMNNLSEYQETKNETTPKSAAHRERKRGVPWTKEEHKLFLLGLQKVGKSDWRGISRNFVMTRTPAQIASHAQKYYLHKTNFNKRRRGSSLFDITTDSVTANPMEQDNENQENMIQPVNNASSMLVGSDPLLEAPTPSTPAAFHQNLEDDDPTLPLNLSLSFDRHSQISSRQQVAPNLSKGDGMISVV